MLTGQVFRDRLKAGIFEKYGWRHLKLVQLVQLVCELSQGNGVEAVLVKFQINIDRTGLNLK
ncbi:hypothetical protein D3C72_1084330 [compost metagenome]